MQVGFFEFFLLLTEINVSYLVGTKDIREPGSSESGGAIKVGVSMLFKYNL